MRLNLLLFLFVFTACLDQDKSITNNNTNALTKSNTTIVIHYKNAIDKKFASFQQYEQYRLANNGIIAPPAHTIENDGLTTTIQLSLTEPTFILLGFNEFYVEPNQTIEIEYTVLKNTKQGEFLDSVKIIKGISACINEHEEQYLTSNFDASLYSKMSKAGISQFFTHQTLLTASKKAIANIALKYTNISKSKTASYYLQQYLLAHYFTKTQITYKKERPKMEDAIKRYADSCLQLLTYELSQKLTPKYWPYWWGMKIYYEQILDNDFKDDNFALPAILQRISNYDDTTKQYILLLATKNNYLLNGKMGINIDEIKKQITVSPFVAELETYGQRKMGSVFMNDKIGNHVLYGYNMNKTSLNELFNTATQKYIYLDFCGSWCKPCIEEISKYAADKKYDNADNLKPLWIFFENDSLSWKKIIATYNLKKENCYLALHQTDFQSEFAEQYNWEGEFPHHFLFSKDGKIIDKKAESLELLNLQRYEKPTTEAAPLLSPPAQPSAKTKQ